MFLKKGKIKYLFNFLFIIFVIFSLIACNDDLKNSNFRKNAKLWYRLSKNLKWKYPYKKNIVRYYINKYKKQNYHFKQLSKYATPYLYHVVEEIEKQNLPGELAIIPMIESAYKPSAISKVGASGLWQLSSVTAKRYGLKSDKWYDGRKDIQDSTIVALTYLKFLYKEFNEDWLLALAAYNAGEGRVKKAILKNKRLKKSTDFWSLPLPSQTKQFVPKILAISYIIKNPNEVGIKLNPIKNRPYFASIDLKKQITLKVAANLAGISFDEIKKLNPGYITDNTHPNVPHKLFLPTHAVKKFKTNFDKINNKNLSDKLKNYDDENLIVYVIKPGDTLSKIAVLYKTSVETIKLANNLSSNTIVAGKKLLIPA